MAVPFSSNDTEVIHRKIKIDEENQCIFEYSVREFFEISRCCSWISSNNFSKVALQFPNSLLKYSVEISLALQKETNSQIFILGDTSYGSCCVDEIAAEHVSANAIIHFGHACLSLTSRLPVLYIFGKKPLDVVNVVNAFKSMFEDRKTKVVIFYEVSYSYAMNTLSEKLKHLYENIIFSSHHVPIEISPTLSNTEERKNDSSCTRIEKGNQIIEIPNLQSVDSYNMFYIGSENQTLMNLMLAFNKCNFFTYNPLTNVGRKETLDVNKYLRKRYYYIERAKDAKVIGILIGTLGVLRFLEIINHLKSIIKEAAKKSYTIVVGKLNSAKLANFSEIEVFVNVACPETSIVDSHEFYQPIVTPYEMEMACNSARTWTGDYITDFSELLPGSLHHVPLNASSEAVSDVSLITGNLRSLGKMEEIENPDSSNSEVAIRDKMTIASIHSDAAGEALAHRSWKGLEQKLGETPVAEIVQGRKGIAAAYDNETS